MRNSRGVISVWPLSPHSDMDLDANGPRGLGMTRSGVYHVREYTI